jgi:hypothetical protein
MAVVIPAAFLAGVLTVAALHRAGRA